MPCSSLGDSLPALGISLSITYLGMATILASPWGVFRFRAHPGVVQFLGDNRPNTTTTKVTKYHEGLRLRLSFVHLRGLGSLRSRKLRHERYLVVFEATALAPASSKENAIETLGCSLPATST